MTDTQPRLGLNMTPKAQNKGKVRSRNHAGLALWEPGWGSLIGVSRRQGVWTSQEVSPEPRKRLRQLGGGRGLLLSATVILTPFLPAFYPL